jgi:AcrR family transcriptional regulator
MAAALSESAQPDAGFPDAGPAGDGDGRRLRRDRNRMAVVDALLDLYGESNLRPSTAEIAERAGLSHRSLFRYFDDFDDLCREAVFRAEQRARPLIPIEVDRAAPLTDRIEALVTQRLRLFEALGPVAQVSRLNAPFAQVLAAELTKNRAFLRAQLTDLFAQELKPAPEASPASKADAAEEADVAKGVTRTQDVDGAGATGSAGDGGAGARDGSGEDASNDSGASAAGGRAGGGRARVSGATALAAADVLCSFEALHLLTTDQGLDSSDVRAVLTSALTALLDRPVS